ncbi:MAG: glycosyltransferase family 2 protein [Deltaproteobacteria bacterium]|nr:glycosyltransferase family 2 protein [Deltaproteobacteria bacterium]
MKISFCLLTLNAAFEAPGFLDALAAQSLSGIDRLLVDSSSDDGTPEIFAAAGFRVHRIPRKDFNHGGTRRLAVGLCPEAEVIVFMTQDAVLASPEALGNLVAPFSDSLVGAAFGRQLPRPGAGPIEAHARLFNYPPVSRVKSKADIPALGIKTAFISNSFAAYRHDVLKRVGGFPQKTIIGEDTYAVGKMLLAGWKVAYCAEAEVFHSHGYSFAQEWKRYFDTGVFHARNVWMREAFGGAEGEGLRFLKSEIRYVAHRCPWLIPSVLARVLFRYLGFQAGLVEKYLPKKIKRWMSAQKLFWD